jgi:hypothetical protein
MTAVAGLRGSGDFATDERPKDFREMILWRNPNGTAPIFALSSKGPKDKPADPEFNWWDEPNQSIRLQVNGVMNTTTTTTFVVDSADPSTSAPGNLYGHADHLVAGDILMVEKTETSTFDNEIIIVSSVTDSTTFVAKRGQCGTSAAAIPDDSFITKIGNAFAEGTGSADSATRNPMKYTNYCQIFKTTYEVTETAAGITNLRTGNALKNEKMRKAFDHSRDIEWSYIFGVKHEGTGANGKPIRFMGGLRSFIAAANQTVFTTSPTVNTFLDAVYPVFDYDTPAGDERILMCGNGFLNELNKLAAAAGTINYSEVVKMYGMNLRRYVLPQGTLYVKTHPLMNKHGRWSHSALVLDMSAIRHRPYRDTKSKDNIQANDEDTKKGQWLSEIGLEVRYGGLTCAYIGNFII